MLKYSFLQEVYQEVPGEISLAISISGCNLNCPNCHSPETHDFNLGINLSIEELSSIILKNKYITCVLFYGGEWNISYLEQLFVFIKSNFSLKIALYTGRPFSFFKHSFLEKLDFIKVGPFIENLGGLSNKSTNQKFFVLQNGQIQKELMFY